LLIIGDIVFFVRFRYLKTSAISPDSERSLNREYARNRAPPGPGSGAHSAPPDSPAGLG